MISVLFYLSVCPCYLICNCVVVAQNLKYHQSRSCCLFLVTDCHSGFEADQLCTYTAKICVQRVFVRNNLKMKNTNNQVIRVGFLS